MEQVETANAYRKYFTMYFVYTYGRFSAQPSLQDFAQVILVILPDQEVSKIHLKSILDGIITDCLDERRPRLMLGNTFQKRKVSSPAPVTMLCPQGLIERYNTL